MTQQVYHPTLASGRWHELSLPEQLGNVGSEISRANRWWGKDQQRTFLAFERALELLDFTLADPRHRHRLKEIARVRELVVDAMLGGEEYGTTLADLDRYFLQYALVARKGR